MDRENGLSHRTGERRKYAGAYFTAEAAMVLPCVLALIVTVIYLLFYQYDRCLMEQELGLLTLEAYAVQTDDAQKMVTLLQSESVEEEERFLALETGDLSISIRGRRIRLSREGTLRYPFAGFLTGATKGSWGISTQTTGYKILPVNFIRNYRKLLGGT